MSEVRSPLLPSLSFSEISSTSSSLLPKSQKRRVVSSSDLQFFTPSATSFKPRPYTPNNDTQLRTTNRTLTRSQDALGIPPLGMDPQPSDPSVVFIHPPFNIFPDSHLYLDGLTYPLMAENPEWFLDPNDFMSPNNLNPHAIPYPPHLEPPRGWCPAKKKDLKERGVEGWPEGEEPRLRCTFCRRTYAGVNAKSMWRRHVFEKHKIAMSNRRDGTDRPRGRGSNKENRQLSSVKGQNDLHERVVNLDVTPQTESRNISHKSRFRSVPSSEETTRRRERDRHKNKSNLTADFRDSMTDDDIQPQSENRTEDQSPPLTPHSSSQISDPVESSESPKLTQPTSPPISHPVIPASPYDPLLTPSFRHSSPRRPSEQPWRFPSPSHPLHSRSRDLSLSVLIRGFNSPLNKGSPVAGESARAIGLSPFPSPRVVGTEQKSGLLDLDSPAKSLKSSPMSLFCRGRMSHSNDRIGKFRSIEESPLGQGVKRHKRTISELADDWLTDGALGTSSILSGNDPFASIWNSVSSGDLENETKGLACVDAVSPVLRSSTALPSGVGLGIGLLDPFTLSED
ncbi:hypothetical protein AMATHDRAFT_94130, partial [Amanita thiersii Skay4041]